MSFETARIRDFALLSSILYDHKLPTDSTLLITLLVPSGSFLCYRTVGNEVVFLCYNPNALLEYANLLCIFQNQGPYATTMLATTILTAS